MKTETLIKGTGVSPGIAIGKAFLWKSGMDTKKRETLTPKEEKIRYRSAVDSFCRECYGNAENIRAVAGEASANILLSHAALANDSFAAESAESCIDRGLSAEDAATTVWEEWEKTLLSSGDSLTRARAADAKDVLSGILGALSGQEKKEIPQGCVVICEEFTPSLASKSGGAAGIIAEKGSVNSHGAILARTMGLPLIFADTDGIFDGDTVICNGGDGTVILSPDDKTANEYSVAIEREAAAKKNDAKYAGKPAITPSGKRVTVVCNAGSLTDIDEAIRDGCDGIGLFRTEFLFTERNNAPDEDEQYGIYKSAAEKTLGRELIIRTLDIGGDKKVPYLNLEKEENPFLGERGIRFCLREAELFKTQIRALLRAAVFGNISIMLPMVTEIREITETKAIIESCRRELTEQGFAVPEKIPVGMMVETPAAVMCAVEFAAICDFFSIGTNDLIQYIMAADRGNGKVAGYYSPMKDAVKKAVEITVTAAKNAGIKCHVCGEAASDEAFLGFLTDIGIDEVSVNPKYVGKVKRMICGE